MKDLPDPEHDCRGVSPDDRVGQPTRIGLAVLIGILVTITVLIGVGAFERSDFDNYVESAELVLAGHDIYSRPSINTWPPLYSVLAVPLALLARIDLSLARAIWGVLMVGCLFVALHLSVSLVYRRDLAIRYRPGVISIASLAAVVPLVLTARFWFRHLEWFQINLLLLVLTMVGWRLITARKPLRGGVLIGLAIAIKILPILLVPYFALKRWWRALGATVVAAGLFTAAPALVFGPGRWREYMIEWFEYARSSPYPGWKGSQSVYSMLDRFLGHGIDRFLASPGVPRPRSPSEEPVVLVVYVLFLASITVVAMFAARRGGSDPSEAATTVELAMVLTAIPLFLTIAWFHYFVFLLPAAVVLWRAATAPTGEGRLSQVQRSRLRWLIGISILLWVPTSEGARPGDPSYVALILSTLTFSALVTLLGLTYLRAILGRQPASAAILPDGHDAP